MMYLGSVEYFCYYILGLCIVSGALTKLCVQQWRSAYEGPCGRLCISSVPGSDQARRELPGNGWVGSPCCQPAVQELQDAGPHHWHWIPSVPLLFHRSLFWPSVLCFFLILILISTYHLVRFSPCSARPRWGCSPEGKVSRLLTFTWQIWTYKQEADSSAYKRTRGRGGKDDLGSVQR